jgi:citrate lyase synthetase
MIVLCRDISLIQSLSVKAALSDYFYLFVIQKSAEKFPQRDRRRFLEDESSLLHQ